MTREQSTKPSIFSNELPSTFITLAEARAQVVENPGDDDKLLNRLIIAAVECVERDSNWMLGSRPLVIRWRNFPGVCANRILDLPLEVSPVTAVRSVTYRIAGGAQETLTDYELEQYTRPAFISLPPNAIWPAVQDGYIDSFKVECDAGLEPDSPLRCVGTAKQACLLLIGHWYANRETVLVGTISKSIEFAYSELIEALKTNRYVH
jgi:uncharacterized phiE125 gp8 family phage protein